MRILLDTHIYLWHISGDPRLTDRAQDLIVKAEALYVSSATLWEIAIKVRLNKLDADIPSLIAGLEPSGFHELYVTARHAAEIATLPLHHTDPIDRMLIAQAMSEPLHLLTADSRLAQYTGLVIQV